MDKHIQIVVPCYNEQECIEALFDNISCVFDQVKGYNFSILFVDDGSRDRTLKVIQQLEQKKSSNKVKYISFARNFGKEAAIYAGLSKSYGDYVVLMDADLQHPPELIPKMIKGMEEGYDCCGARRVSRKGEPPIRSAFSKLFYKIINKVTAMNLVQGGSDYRMMTRQMVEAIVSLSERERFIKGIMSWVGFNTKWIEYENVERVAGTSKWSFMGLVRYALNGFMAFATTPLRAVVYMGSAIVVASIVYAIFVLITTINSNSARTGYSSIIILMLFLGGVIITILGVIGEYMARIYLELKHRPIYIEKISNVINGQKDEEE